MIANPIQTVEAHLLPVLTAAGAIVLWAVTEYFARRSTWLQGAARRPDHGRDQGTYPAIVLVVVVGLAASVAFWLAGIGGYLPDPVAFLGLATVAGGLGLRWWALSTLGRYFTMPITIRADHRIVTAGPYRWLRHPAYTASILVSTGLPLALGTWPGVVITLLLCFGVYLHRISVEEGVLTERFGDEYRAYRHRTWALVPLLY